MARYNREFLVPYLQNVCALHLAEKKIIKQHYYATAHKKRLERGYYTATEPQKPTIGGDPVYEVGGVCGVIGLVACIILRSVYSDWLSKLLVSFFIGVPSLIAMFLGGWSILKSSKEFKKNMRRYHKELEEYNRIQMLNRNQMTADLPAINDTLQICEQEIRKIRAVLQNIYQVNIIPSQYRSAYVAVYLYNWFSTSQADDLDAALNMFVLEEIKDRLDTIIANQSEMILNQRIMMANQQRSIEQQQRHSAMMRSKLNQIAASNEERNIYLKMIESNTATTAYFAAADYIRRI